MTDDTHKVSAFSAAVEALEIRDEFRLLLLCARTRVEPKQRELIRTLALKPLDWEFILGKAYWHSLTPLLYRNLHEFCADRIPSAVLEQLESHYMASAKRNLLLTAELIKVLRILESADIIAVPYKGPTLAVLAYGDVALRKFCDLDLVILPRDILPAKSLLVSHGYEWRPFEGQVTGVNEARNFRFWHEYNFVHPDNNATIDLHWRISSQRFPIDIDLEGIWEHLKSARLLGQDIRVFPVEVSLLFLCIHGSKDLWWNRIGWICDIAEQLRSNPDLDWPYTLELAMQTGARRMLLLGLTLARELLQTPLPEQVDSWICADRKTQVLAGHVRHRLFDEWTISDRILEKPRFHIRVRERLRDKIPAYRYLISAAFTEVFVPRKEDHELIELPDPLSVLYYLVRPARLAQRLWSLAIHRNDITH
ncbi:MAG: nucleotidyltransferase family protein [Gammaproteobacteria bacterium]|nr:MAG: nucleotidyltransferase family protein [Gammaproteobacteria bacterium]